jgi:hypothetical protein
VKTLLAQVVESIGLIFGLRIGIEEPCFVVLREVDGVQIRRYEARVAAETTIADDEESARSEGFRRLARYIFGGNAGNSKIAMTAPVAQQSSQKIAMTTPVGVQRGEGGEWTIRFFMPSKYPLHNLPAPLDSAVQLVPVPAETVAVLKFSGPGSPNAVSVRTDQLRAILQRNDIRTIGEPMTWFYDPPWTIPWCRRNEVAVLLDV